MSSPVQGHYLRPNDKVWTPPAVIFFDTETVTEAHDGYDLERLRLWVAHYVDRRTKDPTPIRDVWHHGSDRADLAQWITTVTRNRETIWAYAHNLSFDLVTTQLPTQLTEAGWEVADAAIGGKSPWMRFRRGKRVLTLVDSWSWLPHALEAIGEAVRIPKPALPAAGDSPEAWLARCQADVLIMQTAILELMAWWDRQQLGRWNVSGASCGWNAFRHKLILDGTDGDDQLRDDGRRRRRRKAIDRILVAPEPEAMKHERSCYHGGRRGTWVVGSHNAGPFGELDFVAAYPTVAATMPLPAGRQYPFDSLPLDSYLIDSDRWGITARVRIETDVPRWPVRTGRQTWYPVGEFWADLAGPDIAEAARLGCLREIGAGWVHRLGYAMAPWAGWVLDVQNGLTDDCPPVARIAAKSWGRSVIGKWAARSFERIKLGPSPGSGWGYEEGIVSGTDIGGGMVDLAGVRWWVAQSGEGDNAYPAIPAWIESVVRVRLGRVIAALGEGAVLQCDTDGLIVVERTVGTHAARGTLLAPPGLKPAGRLAWCLDQLAPELEPLVLRRKSRLSHVVILGPQHLIRDGRRRFSGLPGMAEPLADDRYKVKQWPKLQWQLSHGSPNGYVRPIKYPVVKGPWPTGWVLDTNAVVPPEAVINRAGDTRILGWNSSSYAAAGARPAAGQHPALDPLL